MPVPNSTIDATSIANEILEGMGAAPINSLNEGSVSSGRLLAIWEIARRYLISNKIPWYFAESQQTLAKLAISGTPVPPVIPDYLYQYILPSDFLALTETVDSVDYLLQGDILLSSSDTLSIYYKKDVPVEGEWSPGFVQLFAAWVRYKVIYAFLSSNSARQESLQEFRLVEQDVATSEAQQKVYRRLPMDSQIRNSRFTYFGGRSVRGNYPRY